MSKPEGVKREKDVSEGMRYSPIEEVLEGNLEGKEVTLRGWVYRERKHSSVIFLVIRDSTGVVQCTLKKDVLDSDLWEEAQKITVESSIEVTGTVKEDDRAPGGYEIKVDDYETYDIADRFPISGDKSTELKRDLRHLWIRSSEMRKMMKVRSEVFRAIHDFYRDRDFYEVQSPILTSAACEGGSTLFEVDYFGDTAYLSQSWQLYAEAMVFSLEKIYTIAPSFRAEKSRTRRHLSEYWHHEMEVAWASHEEIMEYEEELILHVVDHVLEHCEEEIKDLGKDIDKLKSLERPFPRITFEEALEELGKDSKEDLTDKEERKLVKDYGKPLFITDFPRDIKAFYMQPKEDDPDVTESSDLLLPGVGEVVGGSARIVSEETLKESLDMFGLDPDDYDWYLDLRKYGSVPHGGFGLGIERLIMWLTDADHIMQTIPFPRTKDRIKP